METKHKQAYQTESSKFDTANDASNNNEEVMDCAFGARLKLTGLVAFARGEEIELTGLVKNSEFNGMRGTISGFHSEKNCWAVELSSSKRKLFKEENLKKPTPNAGTNQHGRKSAFQEAWKKRRKISQMGKMEMLGNQLFRQ